MRFGLLVAIAGLACSSAGFAQDGAPVPRKGGAQLFDEESPARDDVLAEYHAEAERCFPGDAERQQAYVPGIVSEEEREACRTKLGLPPLPPIGYGSGGFPVGIAQVPFQVQIRFAREAAALRDFQKPAYARRPWWQNRHICGGALIGREWVLTAAHCFNYARSHPESWPMMEVMARSSNIAADAGLAMRIDRVVIKRGFDRRTLHSNDIALVHLVADSPAQSLRPAEFARPDDAQTASGRNERTALFMNGWGTQQVGNPHVPVAGLKKFPLSVIPEQKCRNLPQYGDEIGKTGTLRLIHSGVLCAGGVNVKTCKGDSGGPLYSRDDRSPAPVIVGIVSWTLDLCRQDDWRNPGVYTRVAPFARWIEEAKRVQGSGIIER